MIRKEDIRGDKNIPDKIIVIDLNEVLREALMEKIEKIKFIKINGKPVIDATHREIVEKINKLIEVANWVIEAGEEDMPKA